MTTKKDAFDEAIDSDLGVSNIDEGIDSDLGLLQKAQPKKKEPLWDDSYNDTISQAQDTYIPPEVNNWVKAIFPRASKVYQKDMGTVRKVAGELGGGVEDLLSFPGRLVTGGIKQVIPGGETFGSSMRREEAVPNKIYPEDPLYEKAGKLGLNIAQGAVRDPYFTLYGIISEMLSGGTITPTLIAQAAAAYGGLGAAREGSKILRGEKDLDASSALNVASEAITGPLGDLGGRGLNTIVKKGLNKIPWTKNAMENSIESYFKPHRAVKRKGEFNAQDFINEEIPLDVKKAGSQVSKELKKKGLELSNALEGPTKKAVDAQSFFNDLLESGNPGGLVPKNEKEVLKFSQLQKDIDRGSLSTNDLETLKESMYDRLKELAASGKYPELLTGSNPKQYESVIDELMLPAFNLVDTKDIKSSAALDNIKKAANTYDEVVDNTTLSFGPSTELPYLGNELTLKDLNNQKRFLQELARYSQDPRMPRETMKQEVAKGMAGVIRNSLEKRVPEVGPINKRLSQYIPMEKVILDAENRIGNHSGTFFNVPQVLAGTGGVLVNPISSLQYLKKGLSKVPYSLYRTKSGLNKTAGNVTKEAWARYLSDYLNKQTEPQPIKETNPKGL